MNENDNTNAPDAGRDRELGDMIAGGGAPEHGRNFWSNMMDALPAVPDTVSPNDGDSGSPSDSGVRGDIDDAEVVSLEAAGPAVRRRRLAWIAGGSVGAVAAAAIAIASVGGSPPKTTVEGPAEPSTPAVVAPEVVLIESDVAWEDISIGIAAGVVGDSVLVFEPNPEAATLDCQGIGPALRLLRYGTDGSVETLADEHPGSTLVYGRNGGQRVLGATSCEGTPGSLFAEDGGVLVLEDMFVGELTALGLGVVHDAAWIDDQTIDLVIDTTSELGVEPTLEVFRLRWDGTSSELVAADFEPFPMPGVQFVEATKTGIAYGYRDGINMPSEFFISTPDSVSTSVSFDGVLVGYVEDGEGLRLVYDGVPTDVLDPEATEVLGFADDSRHLFYQAEVDSERVVRMMTVNLPEDMLATPATDPASTTTTPTVETIRRDDVEANRGQCHAVDQPASTVEGPAAELAKQIGYAAATCDMEALVELAGDLEGGLTNGGKHLVDLLWAMNENEPGPLQVLSVFMQAPPDRLENGSWIFPHQIVDTTGSISSKDEQLLLSAGYGQEQIAEIASAGQYLGYHVTISEDGSDWVAFFNNE